MISPEEKQDIVNDFPNIKLSYETVTHKKVSSSTDLLIATPKGKKCFVWFTMFREKPTCLCIELDNRKKLTTNIKPLNACFSNAICYGTIFYGTLFYSMKNAFFTIEDVFLLKGTNISDYNYKAKFATICRIFDSGDIKQIAYNSHFVVFGLPIMAKSYDELDNQLAAVKYDIYNIKHIDYDKKSIVALPIDDYKKSLLEPQPIEEKIIVKQLIRKFDNDKTERTQNNQNSNNERNRSKIFTCKPDSQNDVYYLYDGDTFIGLAAVPDYNTSIMLNKLFRIIKENDDLDALELSDDEEEFEDENDDKFVYMDKSYKMVCNYNNRFKKWVPIRTAE